MKHCPKCNREWPDTGKFCPMDGTPLEDVEEAKEEATSTQLLDQDELNAAQAPAEPAGAGTEPERTTGEEAATEQGGDSQNFSETKWFMAGDNIKDEEVEAADKPVDDLQDIYKKTRDLPPDVRKKFSLQYGNSEDGKKPARKKKKK